jgi:hypothetical protein
MTSSPIHEGKTSCKSTLRVPQRSHRKNAILRDPLLTLHSPMNQSLLTLRSPTSQSLLVLHSHMNQSLHKHTIMLTPWSTPKMQQSSHNLAQHQTPPQVTVMAMCAAKSASGRTYKRKFNTDRKKRNRKNRSAREPPPPPVRGPSRVSRPAHASGSRPSASTARQNRPLPYPKLVSASSGARELLAQFASTSTPDQVAHTRALLAQTGAGPENQTKANLSRVFEDQLAQAAEEAAAAGDTPSAGP